MGRRLMIVAGEASGDRHAAKLVEALRQQVGDEIEFFGAAGPRMREVGVEPTVSADDLSIVGLLEIAAALPMFAKAKRRLTRAVRDRTPDAVILVDFPDFNLKLAKSLKKLGMTVVYYISPQLWAWRQYRISTVRKYVDLMITILPFEQHWYAERGVQHVVYTGNPLAGEVQATHDREDFLRSHGCGTDQPVLAFLPGSRMKEISRIYPVMLDALSLVKSHIPGIQALVAAPSQRIADALISISSGKQDASVLKMIVDNTYDCLNAANVAAITSGTATLEAGLLGTPMVVVYKTSALNYSLLQPLIDVEHYALVNLIAGRAVARELIQDEFTPATLAEELLRLLDPLTNVQMRSELRQVKAVLGDDGAANRAAKAILEFLDTTKLV
jgi:lipid-A-disaccharide synthase